MEIRRIFCQKKMFWGIGLLLVLNLFLFCYQQKNARLDEVSRNVTQEEYRGHIQDFEDVVKKMKTFCIFTDNRSFSVYDIEKTQKDYERVKQIEIKKGNNKVITSVVQYDLAHYLYIIMIVFLIVQMCEERECGVWSLVYTTFGGRRELVLKRCGLLCLTISFLGLFWYGSLFFVSQLIYGGDVRWERAIQSIFMFIDIPFKLNIAQFCLVYTGLLIIAALAIGSVVFAIVILVREKSIRFIIIGVMSAVEYLFTRIPVQSKFVLFKYFNLVYYVNPSEAIYEYRNIPFPFIHIIGKLLFTLMGSLFVMVLFLGFIILAGPCVRPVKQEGVIEKKWKNCILFFRKLQTHLSLFQMEKWKYLWEQKGIFLIIALIFICIHMNKEDYCFQSPKEHIVEEFYKEYSGSIHNSETLYYIRTVEKENENVQNKYSKIVTKYAKKKCSIQEYEQVTSQYESREGYIEAVQIINKEKARLEKLEKKFGKEMYFYDSSGYKKLFGKKNESIQNAMAIFGMVFLICLIYRVEEFERMSNTRILIRTCVQGRKLLAKMKLRYNAVISICVFGIIYGIELWNIYVHYGLPGLLAPVQCIEIFTDIPLSINLATFLGILYGVRYLFFVALGFIVLGMTALVRSQFACFISFLVFILPSLGYYLHLNVSGHLALSTVITMLPYINREKIETLIIWFLCMLIAAVIGIYLIAQKWRTEYETRN